MPKAPIWDVAQLRLAVEAAGVALWAWNVDSNQLIMDKAGCDLWCVPDSSEISFEDLSALIHPADRDRVRAAFAAMRAIVGAFEIDFRIIVGNDVRWISARGKGNDEAIQKKFMFGVFLDVTGRKQAEEGNELLAGEMSHRVKNLLAIACGLTTMTARSASTAADMAAKLTQRLSALGRAQDLVRPIPGEEGSAALLGDLLSVLLAPYDTPGDSRIRVAVQRMGIGEKATTTLAMVIHELATNSMKYGALSVVTGQLDVSSLVSDTEVKIVWTERAGPTVVEPPNKNGFGSSLLNRILAGYLRGAIEYDWSELGLIATLCLSKERLAD